MSTLNLMDKIKNFRDLHYKDNLLILPNAWDVLSAKVYELSGAQAIATTSAGIAACFGYPDGEKIPRDLFFIMVQRIIESVNVPVTVDIESGMGKNTTEIAANIQQLINIGAVGINIEDSNDGKLIPISAQIEKLLVIQQLLNKNNVSLFINARIDTYWLAKPEDTPHQLFTETINRINFYQEHGADGIFIPNLSNIETIAELKKYTNLPINILSKGRV